MTITISTAAHNAATNAVTALIGASGYLRYRTAGTLASPGTIVATLGLSADAFADAVDGVATANAITSDTNATGNVAAVTTATVEKSDGTIIIHCSAGNTVTTTITGSSGGTTITVGSATGLSVGMHVSGTGIETGADIIDINGTTVYLSAENTGAVSGNGTFSPDVVIDGNVIIDAGSVVTCTSLTYRATKA
jgi:hypothetical protein